MRMYDCIMLSKDWKKEVLIEFGFGNISVKDVESWFRKTYPMDYKTMKKNLIWVKQQIKEGDETLKYLEDRVIKITAEGMSQKERSKLLDFAEDNNDKIVELIEQDIINLS